MNAPLVIPASAVLKTGKRAVVYISLSNKEKQETTINCDTLIYATGSVSNNSLIAELEKDKV